MGSTTALDFHAILNQWLLRKGAAALRENKPEHKTGLWKMWTLALKSANHKVL